MRKTLLTTALAFTAVLVGDLASASAAVDCPAAAPRVVVERFLSADCESCWSKAAPIRDAAPFVLDWIVPSARGADAPLAVAAVPESSDRAARAGPLPADASLIHTRRIPARGSLRVAVLDGPALNGYIGLQLSVRQRSRQALAPGLVGYIALVERIPAGSEDTPVARQLVRSLIGPFPLLGLAPAHRSIELRATRFPENAKAERLTAVGWVESADGTLLATAQAPFLGCGALR